MKIGNKLSILFVLLSIFVVVVSSILFYYRASVSIHERTEAQLESVVVLKQNQINRYFDDSLIEFETIKDRKNFKEYFHLTHIYAKNPDANKHNHDEIEIILNEAINDSSYFQEIFILDLNGAVHLSTDLSQEGKIKSSYDYFIEGKKGVYLSNFYYDISSEEISMTTSIPLFGYDGKLSGVMVARLNLEPINSIMTERSGLGETGETYLVNKFNYFITESRFVEGYALKKAIYTTSVEDCLKGNSGVIDYKDYRDESVIGRYVWIPKNEVCMIAEIDESEALAPISQFRLQMIIFGIIIAIISGFIGTMLSLLVTRPILKLRDMVTKIAEGNLYQNVFVQTKDEVGDLAKSFNYMVDELKKSNQKINDHQKELEEVVVQKTKELQSKIEELEKFNKLAVGRELKMIELKREIARLEKEISKLKESKTKK